jgi:hypothetical protein
VNLIGPKFGAFGADRVEPVRSNPGVRANVARIGVTYQRAAEAPERTAIRVDP